MEIFLFRFGFETPAQHLNNDAHGWEDEDSQAVFIEGPSPDEAIVWGREIAEAFVAGLWASRGERGPSWKDGEFAHWIELQAGEIANAKARGIPCVRVGEHPILPSPGSS